MSPKEWGVPIGVNGGPEGNPAAATRSWRSTDYFRNGLSSAPKNGLDEESVRRTTGMGGGSKLRFAAASALV